MAIEIVLPTLHSGQVEAYSLPGRFKAIRCGRRWGKTLFAQAIVCDSVARGQSIGFFAPDYRIIAETFNEIAETLQPVVKTSSKTEGVIRTITGGRCDFWTLENPRAGRSRRYHGVVIDEAAFTKPNMLRIWETAIRPTLVDYRGWAIALSNTNGVSDDNFFWQICNEPRHHFVEFHAPTHSNPYLPVEELEGLERDYPPLVYKQEYLAEFVDWSGLQFFAIADCMDDEGRPLDLPTRCDAVFAVVDTATKTGHEHDGTAVMFFAVNRLYGRPLIILDWDIVQIEGSMLEMWMPTIFSRLEGFARQTQARNGSVGVMVEDKASGMILLQQMMRKDLDAKPIDSALTAVGKDERAINASSYVHQRKVGISQHAFDKVIEYKARSRNHMLHQVFGYKLGVKDQEDDLLDCFTYGVALALGDSYGI